MTQEELDALMGGDTDSMDSSEMEDSNKISESSDSSAKSEEDKCNNLPLPATDENKMVHQLDDVTKESEEKASEIFDIIENISNDLMDTETDIQNIQNILTSNIELFETLSLKFTDVDVFTSQLELNKEALTGTNNSLEAIQNSGDAIMQTMDIMQYQDIHRQKIERVINVMRSLSQYMSNLFESKVDDSKRTSSAQHIPGDNTEDLASSDDIEALLAQFGA